MLSFQHTLSTQDSVMQNIIQYIVNPENIGGPPFIPGDQAQKLISSYREAAKASVDIMNDLSQLGASLAPVEGQSNPPSTIQRPSHLQDAQQYPSTSISPPYSAKSDQVKSESLTPTREGYTSNASSPGSAANRGSAPQPVEENSGETTFQGFVHFSFPSNESTENIQSQGGLRVYTVGHLTPRQEDQGVNPQDTPSLQAPPNMPIIRDQDERPPHSVRVRRQTFVPGWAVPPKILLVDDDAVYRNMSSKFLQVFGCEADVAVDGLSALDKLNVEKYDLILMDVVMPNLDGISATNMIRQFDASTPIISMTSNIHSNDIMNYFNSGTQPSLLRLMLFVLAELTIGMNDVLPKPFTKDTLLGMLEKHLLHLKQMQKMGSSIAPPIKPGAQIVDIPETQQSLRSQEPPIASNSLEDQPNFDENNLQFSYDQDYSIFTTPADPTSQTTFHIPPAAKKRRPGTSRDQFEFTDDVVKPSSDTTPATVKRVKYNTPPW